MNTERNSLELKVRAERERTDLTKPIILHNQNHKSVGSLNSRMKLIINVSNLVGACRTIRFLQFSTEPGSWVSLIGCFVVADHGY